MFPVICSTLVFHLYLSLSLTSSRSRGTKNDVINATVDIFVFLSYLFMIVHLNV